MHTQRGRWGELLAEDAAQHFNLIGLEDIAGIRIDGSIVRLSPGIEFRLCGRPSGTEAPAVTPLGGMPSMVSFERTQRREIA